MTTTQIQPGKISVIIPVVVLKDTRAMHRGMLMNFDATVNRKAIEVIIVDNGSEEEVEDFRTYADKYAKVDEMIGFTKALNLGIEAATGEYIVQMNSDVKHEFPDWLQIMKDQCDLTNGIICASPVKGGELIKDSAHGACWMMNRSVIDKVGLWDEKNFNWRFSDQDYWIRAYQAGLTIFESRSSAIIHEDRYTWKRIPGILRDRETAIETDKMIEKYDATTFSEWLYKNPR